MLAGGQTLAGPQRELERLARVEPRAGGHDPPVHGLLRYVRADRVLGLALLAAILSVGALAGVGWAAGFETVLRRIRHPHLDWLALAAGAELLAVAGYTLAYREVAEVEEGRRLSLKHALAIVTAGFGAFVPAGGVAVDREAFEAASGSKQEARMRVLGLGALEYAVLAPATAVAAAFVLLGDREQAGPRLTLPWLFGVPVGFGIGFFCLRYREDWQRRRGWRRLAGIALDAVHVLQSLGRRPRAHALAFVGGAVYWFGDILCLWACLHAFQADPPPVAALVLGYATGYALTRRSLPLGGAGVVESLLPFALGWVGIPLAAAVPAVFGYRVFNLWLPTVAAVPALGVAARIGRRTRRREPAAVRARA